MAVGHAGGVATGVPPWPGACEGGATGHGLGDFCAKEMKRTSKAFESNGAGCADQRKALALHAPQLTFQSSTSEAEPVKKRRARDPFQPQRCLAIAAAWPKTRDFGAEEQEVLGLQGPKHLKASKSRSKLLLSCLKAL